MMSNPAGPAAPPKNHVFSESFGLLNAHFSELDRFLRRQLLAFEPEIRGMADYCIDTSGKRIRPALVFLAGWRGSEPISPEAVKAAAIIELIHLATLVHDDIMDGADVRRGRPTTAREFGSTAAVLLGDCLFAHALNLAAQFPTTEVCAAVSASTGRVCAGEIVQTLRRGSADLSMADYRRIIELKTAELFSVSCRMGARIAASPPEFVEAAGRFGRHLGIAYQIYDDLIDFFGDEGRIGKTLGTDLASGKLTLPLFVLLGRLSAQECAVLREEVAGRSPQQPALRLRQMGEMGVFGAVADAIAAELDLARDALSPFAAVTATPRLLGIAEVLRAQVAALRP
jgi:octaprenyl-diphosphate synthase